MNTMGEWILRVIGTGVLATLVFDLWLLLLNRWGVPTMNFALLGRWIAHMRHGRFVHERIAAAPSATFESVVGWVAHYAIGVLFAAIALAVLGQSWFEAPSFGGALIVGAASVAAPWFILQPAFGAGIASWNTPTPLRNSIRSLANHLVFGAGLYAGALAMRPLFASG